MRTHRGSKLSISTVIKSVIDPGWSVRALKPYCAERTTVHTALTNNNISGLFIILEAMRR